MIFHRLRVLSFSKSLLSIKSVSNTKSEVNEPIKRKNAPEVGLAMPLYVFEVTNTKVPKGSTKKSGFDRMPVKPRLEFKSKSETFRISRKHRKRRNRKALSLNDIKRRLSLKDLNLNFIRQKFQSKKENTSNNNKNVGKKHELKVLYIAESSHQNRKRKTHHRKPKTPQSSCDLFGFYSSSQTFDPHTFYHKYHKDCTPFNKLRARSALKRSKLREAHNCPYTHHPLKVVTNSSIDSDSRATSCTNPLHYNLLKFPKGSKINLRQNKFLRRQCRGKSWTNKKVGCYVCDKFQKDSSLNKVPEVCGDMDVSACGSRKRNTPKNGISNTKCCKNCPSKTNPSKELRDSGRTLKTPCKRRRSSMQSLLKLSSLYHKVYSKLLKCSKDRTKKYSTRNVFEYIFLFLLVIVWSPCIMGIAIGWLLSSPLRPLHVMNDKNEKTRESVHDCFCSGFHFDCWTKYIVNIKRISKASKHVFFNIFRRQKCPKCEPDDLPRCRSHPDPRIKYSLYHTDGRGWVIKPDSPGGRVLSQQKRFMRAFQNMFSDYDCSSQNTCKNTNISGGGSSLTKPVCHKRMSTNASLHAYGNPIINKCGYSNKHVECHIKPKTHNSEDDCKPLAQSAKLQPDNCLKSLTKQKLQATSKHKLKQSNETVQSRETVCKKTVQQQLDNAEKHLVIDHPLKPDKKDSFQKQTKSSEMSNCCHLGTSDKSIIDNLIKNVSGHKDVALSGLEDASKLRVCGKSKCRTYLPEDTATSRVGGKSVPLPQATSSKYKFQLPEAISQVKIKRSLKALTQLDSKLVQPLPMRRSVLKSSSSIRSSPKPDRVTIVECGPSSKSAKPQKCFDIHTQTQQCDCEHPIVPMPKPQPKRKTKGKTLTSKKQGQSVGDDLEKKAHKKDCVLSAKVKTLFQSMGWKTADPIGKTKPQRIVECEPSCKRAKTKPKKKIHLNISNTKSNQTQQRGLAIPKRKLKDKTLPSKKKVNRMVPEKKKPVKRKFYQKKKLPFWHKVGNWFRNLARRSANSITRCDREIHSALYPADIGCADQYLITLRSRPWFWVYRCCPKQYPSFLRSYYCTKNCCFFFLASVSFCFWAPILMCCYLCYELFAVMWC